MIEKDYPSQIWKMIGCIGLVGCLLCGGAASAHAAAPADGAVAPGAYGLSQMHGMVKGNDANAGEAADPVCRIATSQLIELVNLTDLDAPIAGQALDATVTVTTDGVSVSRLIWEPNDYGMANYETTYTAVIILTAEPEYCFAGNVTALVNGQIVPAEAQGSQTLYVRYSFPTTSVRPILLQSITPPVPITVVNGTALDALPLPEQVDIETDDGQSRKADVSWTLVPVDGTSYRPEMTYEQTFCLEGTVVLPDGVSDNGVPLTVTIDVTVAEAAVVPQATAPLAQPAPGRYTADQLVTLTTQTPDAEIYYTLDGSAPSMENGIRYTTPIIVQGAQGQLVKTQIRAIAVSEGLADSMVVTLEYEIDLSGTGDDGDDGDEDGDSTGDTPSGGGSSGGGSSSGGGNSSGGSSTWGGSSSSKGDESETVTNPDGSTTTSVLHPDGSTTTTITKADGSTTTIDIKADGAIIQTNQYPDGSKTVVETAKDGTITTTSTDAAANTTETVQMPAGVTITTMSNKDGSGSVTIAVADADGHTSSKVTLTEQSIADAAQHSGTITLPMPAVPLSKDRVSASTVTVDLPDRNAVKVEIPVQDATTGTVAVLVRSDGTETVLMQSQLTENGITVCLENGDTVRIVDNTKQYTDVRSSHWAADAIGYVTSREIFSGTGATTFSPENTMNRAMIVTVLARLDGVDTSLGANWYDVGRQWAVQNGISDGSELMTNLTREQLAAMLYRYAGSPAVSGTLGGYTDAAKVSSYAQEAMVWAVQEGLLTGTTSTELAPQGQATRAQVAAILQRFVQSLA